MIDGDGALSTFDFGNPDVQVAVGLVGEEGARLHGVVAIPEEEWSPDLITQRRVCVQEGNGGRCISTGFTSPPDSVKMEFEDGKEHEIARDRPENAPDTAKLLRMSPETTRLDIYGQVPFAGPYVFIVHYFQPENPKFQVNVVVQDGQTHEATLDIAHCPSEHGCRALVKSPQFPDDAFDVDKSVTMTFTGDKGVWFDHVMAVPKVIYQDTFLKEQPLDKTGDFINRCSDNEFNIAPGSVTDNENCNAAAFSLTVKYNDGALPCECDYQGSTEYTCQPFGGQCPCKENVIGRRCERCRTGFYGFPACRTCSCPSTAVCDEETGACICPPRVTGARCDSCVALTYGFDPVVGCDQCNCDPHGVEGDELQCDLETGRCDCQENVVGRQCDRCLEGHWKFPHCQPCSCDERGTDPEICDQATAQCFCKANVYLQNCDSCIPGSFNLEPENPDGCTKCFCFGHTSQCTSSTRLSRSAVSTYEGWKGTLIKIFSGMGPELLEPVETSIYGDLIRMEPGGAHRGTPYFVAPSNYTGNKLKSLRRQVLLRAQWERSWRQNSRPELDHCRLGQCLPVPLRTTQRRFFQCCRSRDEFPTTFWYGRQTIRRDESSIGSA